MKFLTITAALVLAATSVLAQKETYPTKRCATRSAPCEKGWDLFVKDAQCWCRKLPTAQELAAKKKTTGKNYPWNTAQAAGCNVLDRNCPKEVYTKFCAEAKAKKYKFQCTKYTSNPFPGDPQGGFSN
ncbi:hypothetical protein MBANPS3_005953 [Mucor bainieri]